MTSHQFDVVGASLYYEKIGHGPILLCISGGDGSCELWKDFAESMQNHFTVIKWDRRGYSRSILRGTQDCEKRLETDANDAAQLIKHVSPDEPVTAIGNSSGAIVALRLLTLHPELLKTLIPYEPPCAGILPEYEELKEAHQEIYDTYRRWGIPPALGKLSKITKADQSITLSLIDFRKPYLFCNTIYWFEQEFMQYPLTKFNILEEFGHLKDKMMLVVGEESPRDCYQYRANAVIARKLGMKLVVGPGEHNGHVLNAAAFAEAIRKALKAKDPSYTNL